MHKWNGLCDTGRAGGEPPWWKLKCKLKPSSVSPSLIIILLTLQFLSIQSISHQKHLLVRSSIYLHHIRIEQLKAREHQKYILVGLSIMVIWCCVGFFNYYKLYIYSMGWWSFPSSPKLIQTSKKVNGLGQTLSTEPYCWVHLISSS